MTPALAATLTCVAEVMAGAGEPWWVIGSAALALHGVAVEPRDVDVLIGQDDARRLGAEWGWPFPAGSADPRFRSAMFSRWLDPPLPVEFMASFAVRQGVAWRPVRPRTRSAVRGNGSILHIPERAEMAGMLALFGREKDLARAALL